MEDAGNFCIAEIGANASKDWECKGDNMNSGMKAEQLQDDSDRIKFYYTKPPIVNSHDSVMDAIKSMVELDFDAAVSTSPEGAIEGIVTDKDICYKVVCSDLDPNQTNVMDVMTPDPRTIMEDCRTSIALSFMVRHSIRHLPVLSVLKEDDGEEDKVGANYPLNLSLAGIVDISHCVFDRLDDLEQKMNEDRNIVSALDALERRGAIDPELSLDAKVTLNAPDVGSMLQSLDADWNSKAIPQLPPSTTVYAGCSKMLELGKTAVIIGEPGEFPLGIFTTKDLIYRVLYKGKDPKETTLGSVCTPQPVLIDTSVSLFSAISIMKDRKIKHLPVVALQCCVAVLEVSEIAIVALEYLFHADGTAAELAFSTPAWKEFWDGKKKRRYRYPTAESSASSRAKPVSSHRKSGRGNHYLGSCTNEDSGNLHGSPRSHLIGNPNSGLVMTPLIENSTSDVNDIRYPEVDEEDDFYCCLVPDAPGDMTVFDWGVKLFYFKVILLDTEKIIRFSTRPRGMRSMEQIITMHASLLLNLPVCGMVLTYKDLNGDINCIDNSYDLREAVRHYASRSKLHIEIYAKRLGLEATLGKRRFSRISELRASHKQFLARAEDPSSSSSKLKPFVIMGKDVTPILRYANIASFIVTPLLCLTMFLYFRSIRRTWGKAFRRAPERLMW